MALLTTTFAPTADCYLDSVNDTTNFGTTDPILFGLGDNKTFSRCRGLLLFNVGTIPAAASNVSATLTLTNAGSPGAGYTNGAFRLARLARTNWIELEATYNQYASGSNWTAAGGDIAAPPSSVTATPANSGANLIFTGAGGLNLAAFVTDAVANQSGLMSVRIVRTSETVANDYLRFYSRDNGTSSNRPLLSVTYTLPSINDIGLLGGLHDLAGV